MTQLIECVPNFSEGRDAAVIDAIREQLDSVEGATVLHVDPGKATNRTVITVAGTPEAVVEAAFRGIAAAQRLIDMRHHSGEHPRMGATDVCPLVPISGVSMDEAADLARGLAERVGRELALPVYLYEAAQPDARRRSLSVIREGEYEALAGRITTPEWKPDFGPARFDAKSGATVIGARDFLVAYNVNLNTTSTRRANAVAFDVREAGRPKRDGGALTGTVLTDDAGDALTIPGTLEAVKAIGWFIDEYGIAQVSMNLTDLSVTPIHLAFDEVERAAADRGMRVTGSELVGLVPLGAMLDAGRHYLRRQQRSLGVSERELVRMAVISLGLNELSPFDPDERIIEYRLRAGAGRPLAALSIAAFTDLTASERPAPGGGSVAALTGALGAALAAMVANLSAHKRGWDDRWEEFSKWAERGQRLKQSLIEAVDDDTSAFDAVLAARQMPKDTPEGQAARAEAIEQANVRAIEVPLTVMRLSSEVFDIADAMAEHGLQASVSDAGVAACCARAAVIGAWLNVRINLPSLTDRDRAGALLEEARQLLSAAELREAAVMKQVEAAIK